MTAAGRRPHRASAGSVAAAAAAGSVAAAAAAADVVDAAAAAAAVARADSTAVAAERKARRLYSAGRRHHRKHRRSDYHAFRSTGPVAPVAAADSRKAESAAGVPARRRSGGNKAGVADRGFGGKS